MPSTPPPPTRIRTPPAPLHGDNYEPYSPRRSTRRTAQSNPYSSFNTDRSPRTNGLRHTTPPPTVKKTRFARHNTQLSSPPSSSASPAQTRLAGHNNHKTPKKLLSGRASHGANNSDSDHAGPSSSLAPHTLDPVTMLPTPSRTPRKRNITAMNSSARILNFEPQDPNDVMPASRKIKKHGRFNSMNAFDLFDEDRPQRSSAIAIFTDTNARVPELDETEDNPFVGPKSITTRPQRSSRRARTAEVDAMEEAARNDEGVIYVFRGKKMFRRFSDPETDRSSSPATDLGEASEQRTLRRQAGAAAQRPLTRSSIKPRLLFPNEDEIRAREQSADEVDEEAMTDIEMSDSHDHVQNRPVGQTPTRGRFGGKPATPPTTGRATRLSNMKGSPTIPTPILEEDEPEPMSVGTDDSFGGSAGPRKGRKSPFDSWQRTKAGGRKRAGEPSEEAVIGKRTRSAAIGSPA
ncbi:hypothetical protein LTR78_000842 [Recurvomyces mirabilis]|uniref:Uncharacterized protein n=1 Tax=Recurvomyces mirabilis TaxID=574656 RepID=A0AAE0WWU6_9PEZI|nr:hypothetical protein LTR78_000842 [Recurvomyces mirabilis]KAK5158811.1 hypothetical protein LTS14_002919 [Recurvomyces mirabilis]